MRLNFPQVGFTLSVACAALLGACSSKSPPPSKPLESTKSVPADAKPVAQSQGPLPAPAPTLTQVPAPVTPALEKSLDGILKDYTKKWRQDYPTRLSMSATCPAKRVYSYGMRMLHPATFQGTFSDVVKQKYGNTTDFIVIAVAKGGAAYKADIMDGDRIVQINGVKSTQFNAGKTLAERSLRWSKPYDITVIRGGKTMVVNLTPDRICDIPL
jgi:membrane-associated protease RseP (regulator of RpoE activity)